MCKLSAQDYQNLLSFCLDINADYVMMPKNTLTSLARIFGFSITSHTTFMRDSEMLNVRKVRSFSFHRTILNKYRERYYKEDPIYQGLNLLSHVDEEVVYCVLDNEHYSTYNTYQKYFVDNKFKYQAVIGISQENKSLIQIVRIYKTENEGDFTPKERALLQQINKIFNQSKLTFSLYMNQKRIMLAMADYEDTSSVGLAILNHRQELLHYNSCFLNMSNNLSADLTPKDIAKDLVEKTLGEQIFSYEESYSGYMYQKNYMVSVKRKKVDLNCSVEYMTFITIENEAPRRRPSRISTVELIMYYELTNREAEIAIMIHEGVSNSDISEELKIKMPTVKSHINSIFSKCDVSNRLELLRQLELDISVKNVNEWTY